MLKSVPHITIQEKLIQVGDEVIVSSRKTYDGHFSYKVNEIWYDKECDWVCLSSDESSRLDFHFGSEDRTVYAVIDRLGKFVHCPAIRGNGKYYKSDGWRRDLLIRYMKSIKPGFDPRWLYFYLEGEGYWELNIDVLKEE